MCGISGFLDVTNGTDAKVLREMNEVIAYRGPDGEGYAFFGNQSAQTFYSGDLRMDSAVGGCFLGLGHRRLAVVDLSEEAR